MTTDSSVQINLADLFTMEAVRRAEDVAAVARRDAEREAREQAERRAREAEARAAEAEARSAEEAAFHRRESEAASRIAKLRAELDAVQAEREAIRLRAIEASAPVPRERRGWLAGSAATLSLVAACVAIFVAWPRGTVVVASPVTPVVLETEVAHVETPVVEEIEAPVAEVIEIEAPVEVAASNRPHRPHGHVRRPPADDLSRELDFGDDDNQVLSDEFLREHRN